MAVDPALDKLFDCRNNDLAGYLNVEVSLTGYALNRVVDGAIDVTINITGTPNTGGLIDALDKAITLATSLTGEAVIEELRTNWVGWSKIGSIVFRQDMTNDSGYRPMPWKGSVYQILRLGKNAVVYGSGGVTLMYPVASPAPTFGCKELISVGVLGKNAMCGNGHQHFFIDVHNRLWRVQEEKITKLGYEEFLSTLVDPVMCYDAKEERVYISDANRGFTLTNAGLGGGYPGLTGFQYSEATQLITLDRTPDYPETLLIVTDILDFGYRGLKSIESIQIGVDNAETLYVALDYRYKTTEAFRTTNFTRINDEGVAHLRATALEFRIRVKNNTYDPIDLDYISVRFKRSDLRFVRGPASMKIGREETYDN